MENIVAKLLGDFENGKTRRRQLIQGGIREPGLGQCVEESYKRTSPSWVAVPWLASYNHHGTRWNWSS